MRIKLDLDKETTERLIQEAVAERRPIHWQAEILLRRSLGLPDRHSSLADACAAASA